MNIFYEPVNINQWDMFKQVKAVGHIEPFLATKSMEVGDLVLLHVGQQNKKYKSGVYAIGEIVEGPYICKNRPGDYCNNKLSVDVKISKINYSHPYITHEECRCFINQFRTAHRIEPAFYQKIMRLI